MPVSFLPLIVIVLLLAVIVGGFLAGRKIFLLSVVGVFVLLAVLVLPVYVHGWYLLSKSKDGDAGATYQLARWHENHAETIGSILLFPAEPDVESGFETLEIAAKANHPAAMYALGVRLKYDILVPESKVQDYGKDMSDRGQELIHKAEASGFKSPVEEEYFYWQVYRQ